MDFAFDYVDGLHSRPAGRGRLVMNGAVADGSPDRPPILLVHGAFHGAWCYGLWLRELERRGWPAAAVDIRGHAGLPRDDDFMRTDLRDYAADVVAAGAAIGRPSVLCGHSLGALVVGVAAEQMDLAGLVLLAPSPPGQLPGAKALAAVPTDTLMAPHDADQAAAAFFPRLAEDREAVARLVARLTPESPVAMNQRFELSVSVDRAAIDAPALCIECALDNPDLHPPGQDQAVADFYDADYVYLSNASHCLMVDPDWHAGLDAITTWAATSARAA